MKLLFNPLQAVLLIEMGPSGRQISTVRGSSISFSNSMPPVSVEQKGRGASNPSASYDVKLHKKNRHQQRQGTLQQLGMSKFHCLNQELMLLPYHCSSPHKQLILCSQGCQMLPRLREGMSCDGPGRSHNSALFREDDSDSPQNEMVSHSLRFYSCRHKRSQRKRSLLTPKRSSSALHQPISMI